MVVGRSWCCAVLVAGCVGAPGAQDTDVGGDTEVDDTDADTELTDTDSDGSTVDDTDPGHSDVDTDPDSDPDTDGPGDTDADTDPADTDDTDVPPPEPWSLGPAVTCADPSARAAAPFSRWDPPGDWQDMETTASPGGAFAGGGVTVVDLDDDGVLDLLRTSDDGDFRWFALTETGPVDRTSELPPLPVGTSAAIPVDFDGDGLLDLHVAGWRALDLLLRQTSPGVFEDVAAARGVTGLATDPTIGSSWADADGDGDLDAFVAVYGSLGETSLPWGDPSHLWIQQADGTFVDAVAPLPTAHPLKRAHTFGGAWVQLDADRTPELYVAHDFGWRFPNEAYDVVAGVLTARLPLGYEAAANSMGIGVGDLNGDGLDDLVVPAWGLINAYVSAPSGWFESARVLGLVPDEDAGQRVAWGAELADLDDDGDQDVLIAFGALDESTRPGDIPAAQPDGVWMDEGGLFVDRAPVWGLDTTGRKRGILAVDLDHDGWLDVVKQSTSAPTEVFRAACGAETWLEVELCAPGTGNTHGVGARVIVEADGKRWSRTVFAGGTSYASAGPPEVHFGLGDVEMVDRIEVRWPDGRVDVEQDVGTRRRVRLTRPAP